MYFLRILVHLLPLDSVAVVLNGLMDLTITIIPTNRFIVCSIKVRNQLLKMAPLLTHVIVQVPASSSTIWELRSYTDSKVKSSDMPFCS